MFAQCLMSGTVDRQAGSGGTLVNRIDGKDIVSERGASRGCTVLAADDVGQTDAVELPDATGDMRGYRAVADDQYFKHSISGFLSSRRCRTQGVLCPVAT